MSKCEWELDKWGDGTYSGCLRCERCNTTAHIGLFAQAKDMNRTCPATKRWAKRPLLFISCKDNGDIDISKTLNSFYKNIEYIRDEIDELKKRDC